MTAVETGMSGNRDTFSVDAAAELLRLTTVGAGAPARASISSGR